MIQLPPIAISDALQKKLEQCQKTIDDLPSYSDRVEKGKTSWARASQIKKDIKPYLMQMTGALRRCHYCEDSYADEIEHFQPKDLYPEFTFSWENLLYACGPWARGQCNGPKNNQFSIFTDGSSQPIDITRKRHNLIEEPPVGEIVLINPRRENPLDYLFLDLVDTFYFVPYSDDPNSKAYIRAEYTIDLMNLNKRDALVTARRVVFGDYRARLNEYIHSKKQNVSRADLDAMKDEIKRKPHQAVWQEMKRQHCSHPVLKELFDEIPEALGW